MRSTRLQLAGQGEACTVAFISPWVRAFSGLPPMRGSTSRSMYPSYWRSVAALRGVPRLLGCFLNTPR